MKATLIILATASLVSAHARASNSTSTTIPYPSGTISFIAPPPFTTFTGTSGTTTTLLSNGTASSTASGTDSATKTPAGPTASPTGTEVASFTGAASVNRAAGYLLAGGVAVAYFM